MTERKRKKAEKILERLGKLIQVELNIQLKLQARSKARNDEREDVAWSNRYDGELAMLRTLGMITINEQILLIDYGVERAYEMADELKKKTA